MIVDLPEKGARDIAQHAQTVYKLNETEMESVRQRAAVMIMARCQTIIELRQELGKKLMHEEARGNTLPGE